jgi:hypothetical protein
MSFSMSKYAVLPERSASSGKVGRSPRDFLSGITDGLFVGALCLAVCTSRRGVSGGVLGVGLGEAMCMVRRYGWLKIERKNMTKRVNFVLREAG